jgi:hypothetical protein
MNFRTVLPAAAAAALLGLAAAAPAQAADTLLVNFSDDASGFIQADPGDQFYLNGLSSSVLLTSGVSQDVFVMNDSESLGDYWDDHLYTQTINHTLTLNGVGQGFSQLWSVWDYYTPAASISGDGPKVYNVTGGTITVTMNAGSSDLFINNQYSASLLYQAVPEPTQWALLIVGFAGAGAAVRGARRKAALTA